MTSVSQRVFYGSSLGGIGLIIAQTVGVVRWLALIRLLTPFEYGVLTVAMLTVIIGNLFANLKIDTAITKFVSETVAKNNSFETKKVFFSSLFLKLIVGIVICFSFFILAEFIGNSIYGKSSVVIPIRIISLAIIPYSIFGTIFATFFGLQEFKAGIGISILNSILDLILSISLILAGLSVMGAVIGYLLAICLTAIAGIILILKKMSPLEQNIRSFISLKVMREIVSFSSWIIVSAILSFFYDFFNSLVLSALLTEVEIAYFQVAMRLSGFLFVFSTPFYQALLPIQTELHTENQHISRGRVYSDTIKFLASILIPILVIGFIFAGPLITLIAGDQYVFSILPFKILLIRSVVYSLSVSIGPTLISMNRQDIITKIHFFQALISAVTSVTLVSLYGLMGGAYAELITSIAGLLTGFYAVYHVLKIFPPFLSTFKFSISAILVGVFISLIQLLSFNFLLKAVMSIILGCISYAILEAYIQGLNDEDISMLKTIIGSNRILMPLKPFINSIDKLRGTLRKRNS